MKIALDLPSCLVLDDTRLANTFVSDDRLQWMIQNIIFHLQTQ